MHPQERCRSERSQIDAKAADCLEYTASPLRALVGESPPLDRTHPKVSERGLAWPALW